MDYPLDATDHKILKILQQDGRITMKKLAEAIAMSSPAATERVRRLEEAGIIEGYRAVVNPEKLGLKVHGYITADISLEKRREFYRYVAERDEITSCEIVLSGGKEALLHVYCRDAAHLMELHNDFFNLGTFVTNLVSHTAIKDEPIKPELGCAENHTPQPLANYDKLLDK